MNDQQNRLYEEIQSKIDYFRQEYQMTYFDVVGVLEMTKLDLMRELEGPANDE